MISNRRLFQIHGWLGVNLGLLLFIVCLSGTVATLSHEIEWLLNPAVRAAPPADDAPFASWTAWYAAAQEAHPAARILAIDRPNGPRWAVRVTIAYSASDWRYVYVDPYTAAVRGSFAEFNVPRFFRSFHKQFYIYPGTLPHGVYAVGPLGLVLLLSLVTGLAFYRFRWRDLLLRGPWRSARAFWSVLHRATGMWCLPMAVLITATGVWYFVERALGDVNVQMPEDSIVSFTPGEASSAPRGSGEASSAPRGFWPMPIEEAVALAERTAPGFRATDVSFTGNGRALTLSGQAEAWLVRDAANTVRVDPYAARVERMGLATHHQPIARWVHTADPLHFGTFGGLATKLIWFAAGLFSSFAILLGVRVWYLRTTPMPVVTARPSSALFSIAITLVVLAISLYGCIVNIGDALEQAHAPRFAPLGVHQIGPVQVRVRAASTDGKLRIAGFAPYDRARTALRRVDAWLGGPARPPSDAAQAMIPDTAVPATATWDGFHALLDLSRAPDASHLWLSTEDAAGVRSYAALPIASVAPGTGTIVPPEIVPVYVWLVIAAFTAVVLAVCVSWSRWIPRGVPVAASARRARVEGRAATSASHARA